MASQTSSFLRLPVELRLQIYHFYILRDEGYFYDDVAGLVRSNPIRVDENNRIEYGSKHAPIGFQLARTCKQIAMEFRTVNPFDVNKLTIFPVTSEGVGQEVAHGGETTTESRQTMDETLSSTQKMERLLWEINIAKLSILRATAPCLDQNVVEDVTARYPDNHFVDCLQFLCKGEDRRFGRHCYSYLNKTLLHREALTYTLQVISKHDQFHSLTHELFPIRLDNDSRRRFTSDTLAYILRGADTRCDSIEGRLQELEDLIVLEPAEQSEDEDMFYRNRHLHFEELWYKHFGQRESYSRDPSAVTNAVQFFHNTSREVRTSIRKLCLQEDASRPCDVPSQIFELIPFMRENPRLDVEHRIDCWQSLFGGIRKKEDLIFVADYIVTELVTGGSFGAKSLPTYWVVVSQFYPWIQAAAAWKAMSLSVTTVFTTSHKPMMQQIFDMLKHWTTLQSALEVCHKAGCLDFEYGNRTLESFKLDDYIHEFSGRSVRVMRDVIDGNAAIIFEHVGVGSLWEDVDLLHEYRSWNLEMWAKHLSKLHFDDHYRLDPPPGFLEEVLEVSDYDSEEDQLEPTGSLIPFLLKPVSTSLVRPFTVAPLDD